MNKDMMDSGSRNSRPMPMNPTSEGLKMMNTKMNAARVRSALNTATSRMDAAKAPSRDSYARARDAGYQQAMLDVIFADQAQAEAQQNQDPTNPQLVSPPTLQ